MVEPTLYKQVENILSPLEQINHLRDLVQHITYKLALLNTRALTDEEREKHERDLNKLLTENKEFLQANQEPYKDAILDLGRLIYECEHDEIVEEKRAMSNDSTNDAEDDVCCRWLWCGLLFIWKPVLPRI